MLIITTLPQTTMTGSARVIAALFVVVVAAASAQYNCPNLLGVWTGFNGWDTDPMNDRYYIQPHPSSPDTFDVS